MHQAFINPLWLEVGVAIIVHRKEWIYLLDRKGGKNVTPDMANPKATLTVDSPSLT